MGGTNFRECALRNLPLNESMIWQYGYNGSLQGIHRDHHTQINLQGCRVLCGTGIDWYPWSQSSSTITTWLLPIVGVLLQAPFTSNQFWETMFSLARWVGNPMASLSYVLWNIRVSGRCAMGSVDMSVPFKNEKLAEHSDFNSIRDSFYLLNAMNQYTMRPKVRQKKEAEGLLRIALFSKDLRLLKQTGELSEPMLTSPSNEAHIQHEPPELEQEGYLNDHRRELAREMREARKRGVVPVFFSTAWFLFSLALSIQSAFGLMGLDGEAHDLALGCLLAWLPVLILGSIVDRNPVAADDIKIKLNKLVDRVRRSLMNDTIRDAYLGTIINREHQQDMRIWVRTISGECPSLYDFFVEFAGQGRVRWHYGCCHPIVRDIETSYIAAEGRDWLHAEQEARTLLVLRDITGGLDWFDNREIWQVCEAVFIVGGTTLGAFILSYFTPTVGLGCRSGGYLFFSVISLALLIAEMATWWMIDATKPRFIQRATEATTALLSRVLPKDKSDWDAPRVRSVLDKFIFKPAEAINATRLIYITLAQTIGAYNHCLCISSSWGGKNYVDLNQYITTTRNQWVKPYWISGTCASVSIMGGAMIYIVAQWLMQSHLATSNNHKAARGLQRTRHFRRLLSPLRGLNNLISVSLANLLVLLHIRRSMQKPTTLRWTKTITCEKPDHDHPKPGRRSLKYQTYAQTPHLSVQDAEGRPLVPESDSTFQYEHSSGPPSSGSSFEMPRLPSPSLGTRPGEYAPLPTQRLGYERRPSNEDLV